jgi:hypothetical protein
MTTLLHRALTCCQAVLVVALVIAVATLVLPYADGSCNPGNFTTGTLCVRMNKNNETCPSTAKCVACGNQTTNKCYLVGGGCSCD